MIKVCEHFYTIQGEGPNSGVPSYLVRISNCSLKCPHCDSKYTWNDNNDLEFDETMIPSNCNNIILTGGEPIKSFYPFGNMDLQCLIANLTHRHNKHIDIETNALPCISMIKNSNIYYNIKYFDDILWRDKNISYVVSPKFDLNCYPSKDEFNRDISIGLNDIFKFYRIKNRKTIGLKKTYYKIVYMKELKDVITEFIKNNIADWFKDRIFIMPLTPIDIQDQTKFRDIYKSNCEDTIEFCKKYGLRYTPRVHIDVYGLKRGV